MALFRMGAVISDLAMMINLEEDEVRGNEKSKEGMVIEIPLIYMLQRYTNYCLLCSDTSRRYNQSNLCVTQFAIHLFTISMIFSPDGGFRSSSDVDAGGYAGICVSPSRSGSIISLWAQNFSHLVSQTCVTLLLDQSVRG